MRFTVVVFTQLAAQSTIANLRLNSGHTIPEFGLGTWRSKPGEVAAAVEYALSIGYRHIDGASVYENEKEVGEGIASFLEKNPDVKRKDLFITSKLWMSSFNPLHVEDALLRTLRDLNQTYLDLYLLHWPVGYLHTYDAKFHKEPGAPKPGVPVWRPRDENDQLVFDPAFDLVKTWAAMEELVDGGAVRSIGVSNFQEHEMQGILDAKPKVKPAVNQVECHPYWNQDALQKWQSKHDIVLQCYSPLGNPSFKPQDGRPNPFPLTNPLIESLAVKHGATAAQVALAWALKRDRVVIPKSVTPARISENFDAYKVRLTQEEIEAVDELSYGSYRQRLANPRNRPGGLPVFPDDRFKIDDRLKFDSADEL